MRLTLSWILTFTLSMVSEDLTLHNAQSHCVSELQSGRVAVHDIDVTFLQKWGQKCLWATAIIYAQKFSNQKYVDYYKVNVQ